MIKERILIWGNGNTLKKNICWIKQLYNIVGITDSNIDISAQEDNIYSPEKALKLQYDFIFIVSQYYEEIKESLTGQYGIDEKKIIFFEDEFLKERNQRFGNYNENVTFYILRAHWYERKNGFFNYYVRAMIAYYHTQKKGYELLVDMKNYYTEYAGLERYGKVNVWEEYFQQPSVYSLEDAYRSANVILSKFMDADYFDVDIPGFEYASLEWWVASRQMISQRHKDWVKPAKALQDCLDREMEKIVCSGKILGVVARGTDYVYMKPENHFIPCDTDEFIDYVRTYRKKLGYGAIYLATEDEDILEKFKQSFSEDELFFSEQQRFGNTGRVLMDVKVDRENDGFLRGMEYCLVVLMLSKCDGLLANCYCGGTEGAISLNGGRYKDIEVIDSGRY